MCLPRSDLRFPLATGLPYGTSQFLLVFGPLSSPSGCVSLGRSRLLPGFHPCLYLLGFLSLILTFLSSSKSCLRVLFLFPTPPWLGTALCWGVSYTSAFMRFPLVSAFMVSFASFVSPVLCLSRGFLLGISCGFLPSFGVSLSSLSLFLLPVVLPHMVTFGLGPSSLCWGPS